ncbi:uncharacterized protein N7498_008983 [Penicillium cinerascens]|uniref:Domain of unknown function at the cortex 1 domain-containing protein n=1 Tax=Penicillium cinerascens TaxID=70096 RepID=A0A9W9JER6_9EURO|nr:uncharacterized protein N7498_008983 [Penicillium cinerascens]KAJ5195545.1 hypothetical protein N7498_008983 [Penicillium cinerascens]
MVFQIQMARNIQDKQEYKLLVMAGPSYEQSTHRIVTVNDPEPFFIDGAHMSIQLHIRIRDFEGLPSESPKTSIYFDHERHLRDFYSISFSFIPKKSINSKDLVWGNDFDHPIRDQLPPGFNIAYKIAKTFIDPGINCDAYSNRPWSYGPALSCFFVFRVGEHRHKVSNGGWSQRSPETISTLAKRPVVEEGGDGDGYAIRQDLGIPSDSKGRRKYFLSPMNRQGFNLEKGREYFADFYNPYFDPNRVVLKLPGIKIKVLKYVSERTHTLRYVFKDRHNEEVYLVVVFKLLFKEELANLTSKP